MRRFLSALLKKLAEMLEKLATPTAPVEEENVVIEEIFPPKIEEKQDNPVSKKKKELIPYPDKPLRDVIDLMEFPFIALSKKRTNPIIYENEDKTQKVVISGHRGQFIASIYDWDIILVIAGKIQEILNKGSDIPSRKITIPRHELLKALHRRGARKDQKSLEKSLDRLKSTLINTTVNNKDLRHRAGFGFIDSWGYLERKNDRETRIIHISLSDWLYELCCAKGSLLKSNRLYFDITSGLKKFLYRTARKHAGYNKDGWEFSLKNLYEKSGSESNLKLFKSKIKRAISDNDLPDYSLEWIDRNGKISIGFKKRSKVDELGLIVEKYEENNREFTEFKETGDAS
jgi:plasmid replication initiation protein